GKTVHPIPELSLRKVGKNGKETVVELDFSVDYTVAYLHNKTPGTATLFIKGAGRYAGLKTTTFHIASP
ncbi:MAG: hypothetical protein LBP98_01300, partial [Tannerella sp.]|nr:hypothetical protein [Tannerella sp.]MDR2040939.1 hypothetical protein [Tannerella sp.]